MLYKHFLKAACASLLFFSYSGTSYAQSADSVTCESENLDLYQLRKGHNSAGSSFVTDAEGNFYVAGGAFKDSICHWVVRKSTDGGKTWKTVDDYQFKDGAKTRSDIYPKMGTDKFGNIYTVGFAWDGSKYSRWIVRKSDDLGETWKTVDNFRIGSDKTAQADGFASDANGHLYVIGHASDGKSKNWVIRKSTDSGATWNIVDTYKGENDSGAKGQGITVDANGNLYAVGIGMGGPYTWIVRKSTDGGETWSTVDTFRRNGEFSVAEAVEADIHGNVFVAGYGYNGKSSTNWVVRKSSDGGETWNTVQNFQIKAGRFTKATSLGIDSNGNVYVAGQGQVHLRRNFWMVKRSSDQGETWTTIDKYMIGKRSFMMLPRGLGIDKDDNVYTVGGVFQNGVRWLTRKHTCD